MELSRKTEISRPSLERGIVYGVFLAVGKVRRDEEGRNRVGRGKTATVKFLRV